MTLSEGDRIVCIGCKTSNPPVAEVCSGCGHRPAGPSLSPTVPNMRPSGDEPFDNPYTPPNTSIARQVGTTLGKIVVILLAVFTLVFALVCALVIAFAMTCGNYPLAVDFGMYIAWSMVAGGLLWILILGLNSFRASKDSGQEK
jgi:uncharacterized integral membrane protein